MSDRLNLLTRKKLDAITSQRDGETKVGETAHVVNEIAALDNHTAAYVVFGISEDIGIRANFGIGGASTCWDYALASLVNVQSNRFLNGNEMIILGNLDFTDLMKQAKGLNPSVSADLKKLRDLTAEIDTAVTDLVQLIIKAGKTPVIVGGGHNNAYGNIAGTALALEKQINVLNIDPHADYRALEGRHSGNGFSYAREQGHMDQYAVYGLHEGYNNQIILETFSADSGLYYESFESLLNLTDEQKYRGFMNLLNWFEPIPLGLELDLDSITNFPVSAMNPSGFSLNEVRKLIRAAASLSSPAYFHICEGSPGRASSEQEKAMIGKSIAYLITDFIKAGLGN